MREQLIHAALVVAGAAAAGIVAALQAAAARQKGASSPVVAAVEQKAADAAEQAVASAVSAAVGKVLARVEPAPLQPAPDGAWRVQVSVPGQGEPAVSAHPTIADAKSAFEQAAIAAVAGAVVSLHDASGAVRGEKQVP